MTSNSRPPGWFVLLFHKATTPLFFGGIEQDQRAIARDPAAMADDAMSGIIVAAPAIAVIGLAEPLEELAKPAAFARSLHQRRMDRVQHLRRQNVGHLAHLRDHPQRHVLDVAVDAAGGRHAIVSVLELDRAPCRIVRARPAFRARQPVHRDARVGHADRVEQHLLDRPLVGRMHDALDELRRAVIGDVLVAPAGARRADEVQLRERLPQELGVLPLLQLVVIGVAIEAEPVAQHVADRRAILGARRELQRRHIGRDRRR